MKTSRALRYILTLCLLFGVYKETGPFTTISLFLLSLSIELIAMIFGKLRGTP